MPTGTGKSSIGKIIPVAAIAHPGANPARLPIVYWVGWRVSVQFL
ncbi:hypothetical protein QT971_02800 [Microcoleus sp. herbarium19]